MQVSLDVAPRIRHKAIHGLERGTDHWDDEDLRLQLDHRGSTVVGPAKWQQFAMRLRQDSCDEVADFDYELSMAMRESYEAVTRILARTFREQGRFERVAAAQCAKRMMELDLSGAERLSTAVRALGVYACLIQGLQLDRCRCAQPWLTGADQRAARAVIARALPLIPG
jgi:hypothetical protein